MRQGVAAVVPLISPRLLGVALMLGLGALGCANQDEPPPLNTPSDSCIDTTQAYCNDVGLSQGACAALIAEACSEGPSEPGEPDPTDPTDPGNPGNDQCLEDFVAQCTQFGVDPATCEGYAAQFCDLTNPTDPGEPTNPGPSECEVNAQAQCQQFGLDEATCAQLTEQICGAIGGDGGGLPEVPGGGGGGSDPLCLINTIAQCTEWGLDLATCASLAGPICEYGGIPDLGGLGL